MPRLLPLLVLAVTVTAGASHAQGSSPAADIAGTWSGTYAGDGSGKYTMVISREAGKLTGTVDTVADGAGEYKATFKSIVVDGKAVKMAYDEPDNPTLEVSLEATVDGASMTGTWKSTNTDTKNVVASGTFTGSRN